MCHLDYLYSFHFHIFWFYFSICYLCFFGSQENSLYITTKGFINFVQSAQQFDVLTSNRQIEHIQLKWLPRFNKHHHSKRIFKWKWNGRVNRRQNYFTARIEIDLDTKQPSRILTLILDVSHTVAVLFISINSCHDAIKIHFFWT